MQQGEARESQRVVGHIFQPNLKQAGQKELKGEENATEHRRTQPDGIIHQTLHRTDVARSITLDNGRTEGLGHVDHKVVEQPLDRQCDTVGSIVSHTKEDINQERCTLRPK